MSTFSIPLNALRAARTHSADTDVRYWLQGVYLDFRRGKIVATDGHRMFVGEIVATDADPIIIRNETIDAALKQFGKDYSRGKAWGTEGVILTLDGCQVTIHTPTGQVTGTVIDATYPDYARVVPTQTGDISETTINGRYLADAFEALAIYANRKPRDEVGAFLSTRGNSPTIVTGTDVGAFCIIMPMRRDAELSTDSVLEHFHGKTKLSVAA